MRLDPRALLFSVVGLGLGFPSHASPADDLSPAEAPAESAKAWARPKRALELEVSYRLTDEGEVGNATSFQLQPMLFWNRRIFLGTRFGIDPIVGDDAFDSYELDLYVGYQHYLGNSTVPFLRAFIGAASGPEPEGEEESESVVNYGAELGVKLYANRSFYAVLTAGSTRAAPIYGLAGIGLGLRMGTGGGNSLKAAIFIPIVVGLAAALVPWGVDRALR